MTSNRRLAMRVNPGTYYVQMVQVAILALLKEERRPRSLGYIARCVGFRYYYDVLEATGGLEERGFVTTHHPRDGEYRVGGSRRMVNLVE